jgi:hypothetical protein
MKTHLRILIPLALLALAGSRTMADPLGTAFTYQGRLQAAAKPADGLYDFLFRLYDAPAGGNQVGPLLATNAVPVSEGLFVVELDFGAGTFTGEARWLQISVQTNGAARFTLLTPRHALTPTPQAHHASDASSAAYATAAGGLAGSNLTIAAQSALLLTARNVAVECDGTTNTVAGSAVRIVGLNASERVGGQLNITVGGRCHWEAGSDVTATLGRHFTADMAGECVVTTGTNLSLRAGDGLTLRANNEILMETGDALIRMTKNGDIMIKGKDITIDGTGKIIIPSNGPSALTFTATSAPEAPVGADSASTTAPLSAAVVPAPAPLIPIKRAATQTEGILDLPQQPPRPEVEAALAALHLKLTEHEARIAVLESQLRPSRPARQPEGR